MPILPYRAKQSTNTTGTGTIVLNAADTNARNFSAAYGASSRRVLYMIAWQTGYEMGLGDFDGGTPGNLTRATVLASSNAGALVTLPGGTKDVFAVFDPAAREVVAISGTATLALADLGNAVVFTGASAASLNLPAAATAPIGAGWLVMNSGTAALTIDPNGAELVNGAATLVLQAGASVMLTRVGSAWSAAVMIGPNVTGDLSVSGAIRMRVGTSALPSITPAGDPGTGIYAPAANALGFSLGGLEVARLENANFGIGIASPLHRLTAVNVSIPGGAPASSGSAADPNAVARMQAGTVVIDVGAYLSGQMWLQCRNASNYATNYDIVINPNGGGIGLGTNSMGSARVAMAGPATVDGKALQIQRATEQATTSGTAIDFTSIPAGVRRITVLLNGVSTNGSAHLALRIGPSGGIVSSGYDSFFSFDRPGGPNGVAALASAFGIWNNDPGNVTTGVFELINQSGNLWLAKFTGIVVGGGNQNHSRSIGSVSLSGVLSQLRLTTDTGTPTFDAGAINIMWEF